MLAAFCLRIENPSYPKAQAFWWSSLCGLFYGPKPLRSVWSLDRGQPSSRSGATRMLVAVIWRKEPRRWAVMGQFRFQIKRYFDIPVSERVHEPPWRASPSAWVNTCRSTE